MATLHGTCLCGGVKFEVAEVPETLVCCHCESCKKLSGGAATVNVRVPSAAVRILEGRDLLQTYQPPGGSAKNLFGGGWPDSPVASVRATTFDEPFDARPRAHIYVSSVARWETLPDDDAERFETASS